MIEEFEDKKGEAYFKCEDCGAKSDNEDDIKHKKDCDYTKLIKQVFEKVVNVEGTFTSTRHKKYKIKKEIEFTKQELEEEYDGDMEQLIDSFYDDFTEEAEEKFEKDFNKGEIEVESCDFELDYMESELED
jgi:hypothetical protein